MEKLRKTETRQILGAFAFLIRALTDKKKTELSQKISAAKDL